MANPTPLGETYLISPRGGAPVAHAGRWVLGLATLRLTCLPGPGRFGMCGSLQRTFWTSDCPRAACAALPLVGGEGGWGAAEGAFAPSKPFAPHT